MRQHPNLHATSPRTAGFTLVELSIVLVIIGLLVGGILAGQSLIRSAELKNIVTDVSKYRTALTQFKSDYKALPGDMTDATDYWGRMNNNADCVTNSGAAFSTSGACDGDGDGLLRYGNGASQSTEAEQLWRQLSLAGLINGQYTGLNGPGNANYDIRPGVNTPVSILPKSTFWFFGYWGVRATDDGQFFAGDYTNTMVFGAAQANDWPSRTVLKPKELYEIDVKIDDGKPAFGFVRSVSFSYSSFKCTTSDTGSLATYTLTSDGIDCIALFLILRPS